MANQKASDLLNIAYELYTVRLENETALGLYKMIQNMFPATPEAEIAGEHINAIIKLAPNASPNFTEANWIFDSVKIPYNMKKSIVNEVSEHGIIQQSIWIQLLRVTAWINLFIGIIIGITSAYQVGRMFSDFETGFNFMFFIIVLLVSIFATLITTAVIMVFLDIARDISITKQCQLKQLSHIK
jgi:hypothetical protein